MLLKFTSWWHLVLMNILFDIHEHIHSAIHLSGCHCELIPQAWSHPHQLDQVCYFSYFRSCSLCQSVSTALWIALLLARETSDEYQKKKCSDCLEPEMTKIIIIHVYGVILFFTFLIMWHFLRCVFPSFLTSVEDYQWLKHYQANPL